MWSSMHVVLWCLNICFNQIILHHMFATVIPVHLLLYEAAAILYSALSLSLKYAAHLTTFLNLCTLSTTNLTSFIFATTKFCLKVNLTSEGYAWMHWNLTVDPKTKPYPIWSLYFNFTWLKQSLSTPILDNKPAIILDCRSALIPLFKAFYPIRII